MTRRNDVGKIDGLDSISYPDMATWTMVVREDILGAYFSKTASDSGEVLVGKIKQGQNSGSVTNNGAIVRYTIERFVAIMV